MWISKGTKLQAGTVKMGSSGQKGGEKMMFLGAAARRQRGSDSVAAGQGRGVAGVWQGRGRGVAGWGRAGQGSSRQGAHPGRQLAAAFALGSQGVAMNHHPLDFKLAKEIKITLIRVRGDTLAESANRRNPPVS